jgi:Fe-S cluster assembly protein SufB
VNDAVGGRQQSKGVKTRLWSAQVETGSAITWKYPSCILKGDGSVGEFYSVALTNNAQQADTGGQHVPVDCSCF